MASIDPHRGRAIAFDGYCVLVSNADGTLLSNAGHGLFDYDTRILSGYRIFIDNVAPQSDTSASVSHDFWVAHLTASPSRRAASEWQLPQDVIGIELRRRVGCGMAERLRVRNHSMAPITATLRLEFDADFLDVVEVASGRQHHGRTRVSWNRAAATSR